MTIAEFVKEHRKKVHWTQKDLAFYGGVGLRFVRELEQGKTSLRMDKVNQILVYNRYGDSLVTQMTHKNDTQINPYHNKMRAFGMAYDFYNLELVRNIEKLAHRIEDEYNKIYPPNPEEKYGKSEMAKWWSNVYSASTAWCKMRCIGWDGERDLTEGEVNILAKVEHARWNMEQLLMGYRPIDATKQKELTDITNKEEKKTKKNKLKSQMIHLNICSFNKLEEIDGGSIQVDKGISSIIAEELKGKIVKKDKEEPKTTEPEDQFGLTDILKLLEQPQKVQQISNNQKEVFVSFLFF